MWYRYEGNAEEREFPYSVATRTIPTQDITQSGEEALVIWFYGQGDNDSEAMYAALTDGSGGTAKSYYGVLGDDVAPGDIDQVGRFLHAAQQVGVDHSDGLRRAGQGHEEEVRGRRHVAGPPGRHHP